MPDHVKEEFVSVYTNTDEIWAAARAYHSAWRSERDEAFKALKKAIRKANPDASKDEINDAASDCAA